MLDHLDRIEATLRGLPPGAAFGYAVSCAERQYPVYERASQGAAWGRPALMRSCLDSLWAWLIRGTPLPPDLPDRSSQMVFNNDHTRAFDWMAFDITNAFNDFVSGVPDDVSGCHLPGQISLEIIDSFLSDAWDPTPGDGSDALVDNHPLTQTEMDLQSDSIAILAGSPSREGISRVRAMSAGQPVLGSMWYPL
ncbi:MAG: DUF416 family protein [Armatimonadaceae bacterium]